MTKTIEGGIVLGVAVALVVWFVAWRSKREGDRAIQRLGIDSQVVKIAWGRIVVLGCVAVSGAGFWFGIAKLVAR